MRLKTGLGLAFSAAVLSLSTPAAASIKQFTLTGDASMVFSIDDSIAPNFSSSQGTFTYQDIATIVNGTAQSISFSFYSAANFGGFFGNGDFYGPQLYSGTSSDPTFLTGTFSLTELGANELYSLTITEASATPEPATWAMLIIGFGAVGMTVRRRRRAVQPAIA